MTVEVVIRIRMDEAKVAEYVCGLYAGPPDDPAPEPLTMIDDWIAEMRGRIEGHTSIDTLWFDTDNEYVESVTVERTP